MSTSTDFYIAGLDAKIAWLETRMEALELGPTRRARWCWRDAPSRNTDALWLELTAWVDWLTDRYGLDEILPPCWNSHAAMVEELTALYAGWHAAYLDIEARNFDPLAWHEALSRTMSRVRDWNRQGCRADAHREDPMPLRAIESR